MAHLRRAIEIDPQYADAMSYLNLFIRERADLRDTKEQYRRDIEEADQWVGERWRLRSSKRRPCLHLQRSASAPQQNVTSTPQRIRVDGNVQHANLVRQIAPVCSPLATQARIGGKVKFSVVVEKAGGLRDIQVISGHPLLIAAALDAVKQWEYRPTLLNGEPVEVVTSVELNMPCGNQ